MTKQKLYSSDAYQMKIWCPVKKSILKTCVFGLLLAAAEPAYSQSVSISSSGHLDSHSNPANLNAYELNYGASYSIDGRVDISSTSRPVIIFGDPAESFTASASGDTAHRLSVGGFILNSGTLNATGGSGSNSAGLFISSSGFQQNGGTVNAQGSLDVAAGGSRPDGIYIQGGGYKLDGASGQLMATGGSRDNSNGLRLGRGDLVLTDGQIKATGGSGRNANGIHLTGGSYIQYGGLAEGLGSTGTSTSVHGIRVDGRAGLYGGELRVSGGGNNRSGMFVTNGFTMHDGLLKAAGGNAFAAYGLTSIYAPTFMYGGRIEAEGGTAGGANAVQLSTFELYGGEIESKGGSTGGAQGVYGSTLNQHAGEIKASASDTSTSSGLYFSSQVNQSGGKISAYGGAYSGGISMGFFTANLSQTDGEILAEGGSGTNARGFQVNSTFTQAGGQLTAAGGTGSLSYGLRAPLINQNSGLITAIGGNSADGYGIFADSFNANSRVRLERPDKQAASVFVNTDRGLVIGSGAVIEPVIDTSDTNPLTSSGLISTLAGNTVVIGSGAVVNPWFEDHRSLTKGAPVVQDNVFIDTGAGGTIEGEFLNAGGGLTIEYTVSKINNGSQYAVSYERKNDVADILDLVRCDNARRLLGAFDDLFDGSSDQVIKQAIGSIDHSQDLDDLNRRAAWVGLTLTPQAYTKLTHTQMRVMDMSRRNFSRQIRSLSGGSQAPSAGYGGGDGGRTMWLSPLYQKSSSFKSLCYEFDSPDEELKGASFGLGKSLGPLTLGFAFNMIDGEYDSSYSDIDTRNFTMTAGGRLSGTGGSDGWFSPWLEFDLGLGRGNIQQKLVNFNGLKSREAASRATMFQAGLAAGNDFLLTDGLLLRPSLGLDFSNVRQSGYHEEDPAGLGLYVRGNTYKSLRPNVGLEFQWLPAENLLLSLGGQYRYETLDRNSSFAYSRLSAPGLVLRAEGEDRDRGSGSISAALEYRISDSLKLSAGADVLVEDGYSSRAFNASVGFSF